MALTPGTRIGPYEVAAPLGAGGMGEVYRATDTKLKRQVAIKILPPSVAADADRLARFQREAEVLASLNHPNIAQIHGLEESRGMTALVMELVEGEDLSQRIARGAIPLDEALPIARQIAEALEAAHEQGIIHRDLKPANIKVRADGTVKVLDFGLAKAMEPPAGSSPHLSQSPTITSPAMTQRGVILGTAAYMAPEQARGRAVDKRADIWAFGVVLYEMLTGRRAFDGEDTSDVLVAVLSKTLDFSVLPAAVPAPIRTLLRRCLERDPKDRLRDIGEARIALTTVDDAEEAARPLSPPAKPTVRPAAVLVLGVLSGIAAAAGAWALLAKPAPPQGVARFTIPLPPGALVSSREYFPSNAVAVSRDGSMVVVAGTTASGRRLYVKRHDDHRVVEIPGTGGACNPFFSPDGTTLAFFGGRELKKVSLGGGDPVIVLRDVPDCGWGATGSWTDDGRIIFDRWGEGLRVVAAGGGDVSVVTAPQGEIHSDPQALPGADIALYVADGETGHRVEAIALDGSRRKTVLPNASHARYLASGHLLFMRDGALMLARFDKDRVEVTGEAVPVPVDVEVDVRVASAPLPQAAVSMNGTLVYAPVAGEGDRRTHLMWVDRQGRTLDTDDVAVTGARFHLSPDGRRLVLAGRSGPMIQAATYDLAQKTLNPLTRYRQEAAQSPIWFPDGRRVLIGRYGPQQGELQWLDVEANTPPQSLVKIDATWLTPASMSRDGRYAMLSALDPKTASIDLWSVDLGSRPGAEVVATRFLATPASEEMPALSPDGHWVAYVSDESGRSEVYVRRFPGGEEKRRVSKDGGGGVQWAGTGRELFFIANAGAKMMAATVSQGPVLQISEPRLLFEGSFIGSIDGWAFAVSPDATRFLVSRQEPAPTELVVVQHWFEDVRRLAPN